MMLMVSGCRMPKVSKLVSSYFIYWVVFLWDSIQIDREGFANESEKGLLSCTAYLLEYRARMKSWMYRSYFFEGTTSRLEYW